MPDLTVCQETLQYLYLFGNNNLPENVNEILNNPLIKDKIKALDELGLIPRNNNNIMK